MKQRLITALLIIACVLPPLILGGIALEILILAFVGLALAETIQVCFKRVSLSLYALCLILALGLSYADQSSFLIWLGVMILIFFSISVFNEHYSIENCAYLMVMMLIMAMTVQAIHLVYTIGNHVMLYLVIATYMTDTGAYFAGRAIGKHKLNERISPKKTIEGAIGGYILGAASAFVFGKCFVQEFSALFLVLVSFTAPAVGQLGDLAFSAIKRHFSVKDFGSIFPGHGGVLDRIDSLIFNLLIFLVWSMVIQLYLQGVMI